MIHLFSEAGLAQLDLLLAESPLLAFDFDGTLSPLIADPREAWIPERTKTLLESLISRAPVAVLSGRSCADLRVRLGLPNCHLVGNHGIEVPDLPQESLDEFKNTCRAWYQTLRSVFDGREPHPDIRLEDKDFSLSLHYRGSKKPELALASILYIVQQLRPAPRIVFGQSVVNLLPTEEHHKGTALRRLMVNLSTPSALFVGDDETDEDAFSLDLPGLVTVRIGESPSSKAQFFLNGQHEMNELLTKLCRASR